MIIMMMMTINDGKKEKKTGYCSLSIYIVKGGKKGALQAWKRLSIQTHTISGLNVSFFACQFNSPIKIMIIHSFFNELN